MSAEPLPTRSAPIQTAHLHSAPDLSAPDLSATDFSAADSSAGGQKPGSGLLRKGARITGETRDKLTSDLRRKYERGQSIRSLAENTGRSYGFVHRILVDGEVPMRSRGGATRTKKK